MNEFLRTVGVECKVSRARALFERCAKRHVSCVLEALTLATSFPDNHDNTAIFPCSFLLYHHLYLTNICIDSLLSLSFLFCFNLSANSHFLNLYHGNPLITQQKQLWQVISCDIPHTSVLMIGLQQLRGSCRRHESSPTTRLQTTRPLHLRYGHAALQCVISTLSPYLLQEDIFVRASYLSAGNIHFN